MIKPYLLVVVVALAIVPAPVDAQGTIQGTVRSAESGAGLGGAQIELPSLGRVTLTTPSGSFALGGVPAGTHTLEIRLIGYGLQRREVAVADGQTVTVDIQLGISAFMLDELVVVGSRAGPRTVTESMVPVDVIPAREIAQQAETNIDFALRNVIPSFNVNQQPISDAGTIIRPANMRGLASDHTLVLVNGKRRHRGAVITWLGGGLSDGAQGPDIGSIPAIGLRQVEVLRDGASAQYGSDAIAGVLNFQLKDDRSGGAVQFKRGQFFDGSDFVDGGGRRWDGDGKAFSVAGNFGVPLGESGFANITLEYGNQDPTDRAIQRSDAADLVAAGNSAVRTPTAQVWGAPRVSDDLKAWLNTGYSFDDDEQVYAFGNIGTKRVDGGFFFRNPNTRGGVFSADGGETLLVGDVLQAKGLGSADCPVVRITNNVPDPVALQSVFDNPNCFTFQEMFPGGFTPQFGGDVLDASLVGGVRGRTGNGVLWDASASWGRNFVDYFIYNTVNAALGPETPTSFDPGSYEQEEVNFNLDLAYQINELANIAGGFEQREERFAIGQGQDESWQIGPYAAQGFSSSSNGFPGFSPLAAGDWSRRNTAVYADLNLARPGAPWSLGLAARYEDFSDFGGKATGKVSGRFEATEEIAVRASATTGFRAPTPGQQNAFNVSTVFDTELGDLVNRGTIPSTSAVAALRGGRQLEPESSVSLAAGVMFKRDALRVTADYFRIDISDRFSQTSTFELTDAEVAQLVAEGITSAANLAEFRFFTNDFETLTQGIDLVASYSPDRATDVNLLFNYTSTEVTNRNPDVVDDARVAQLERALPRFRSMLSLRRDLGPVSGMLRGTYYDGFYDAELSDPDQRYGSRFIVDAELAAPLMENASIAIGANNLFNTYPDQNPNGPDVGARYPESTPFGFNGGYYYVRLSYDWLWRSR
ncbi:MAG: TonB-dependent receptor [Gemmatimonadetes bacterium]|nr:TonB-dependent receptor [Gemmatimonadota bacterium]